MTPKDCNLKGKTKIKLIVRTKRCYVGSHAEYKCHGICTSAKQKISRHNVTGESACGDIDDENDGVHML
jgi:hypothetical protein